MPITWSKDLSVGIEAIDIQHRELFRRIDDLLRIVREGKGSQEVHDIFRFLSDYIGSHFATEEKCMRILSYPGYENHIGRHKIFIATAKDLDKLYDESGVTEELLQRLQDDICDWIINHILVVDMELGAYIKDHGGELVG